MQRKRVVVAGGFDPLHDGHRSHIEEAAKLGNQLIVITHPDEVMVGKKGFCYQPLAGRIAALEKLPCVDEVVVAENEGGTVAGTLKLLRPDIFAKGGDRTPGNMPECEVNMCREIGCRIAYGVGCEKVLSSSKIAERAKSEKGEK